jgi:hypothetical protein
MSINVNVCVYILGEYILSQGEEMRIFEVEIEEIERNALSQTFSRFVVIAENFEEAKKKGEQYIELYPKIGLEIKSISEKYIIENL